MRRILIVMECLIFDEPALRTHLAPRVGEADLNPGEAAAEALIAEGPISPVDFGVEIISIKTSELPQLIQKTPAGSGDVNGQA